MDEITTELRPLADIERDIKLVRAGLMFADDERAKLFRTVNTWAVSTLRKKLWHVVIPDELATGIDRKTRLALVQFYLELHHPKQPLLHQHAELTEEWDKTVKAKRAAEKAAKEREREQNKASDTAAVEPTADAPSAA